MGWLVQMYEGHAHVVPDTEPGHVLSDDCFCEPVVKLVNDRQMMLHNDELNRVVLNPFEGGDHADHEPT